ncbi:MAG: GAF domain-containing protein [Candidatus Cloacimonetes bacterium]|nr:GAF domain-containing protein [Candidatus Cloacimonadota bacterium]
MNQSLKFNNNEILTDQNLLTALLNILPEAAVIQFKSNMTIVCNEKAVQLFAKNHPEQVSAELQKHLQVLAPAGTDLLQEIFRQTSPRSLELAVQDKLIQADVYPLINSKRDITHIAFFFRDITRQRELEMAESRKSQQLEKLLRTARHLTESLDIIDVLTRIGNEASAILNAYSAIYLLEEDGVTLTPQTVVDPVYAAEIMSASLNINSSLTGRAVKLKKSLLFNEVSGQDDAYQIPGTSVLSNERIIVTPFLVDEQVLGAMCLNRIGNIFTEEDLNLAQTFAAYAATALKNAKTYNKLLHEVEERRKAEEKLAARSEHMKLINRILRHDITNNLVASKSALKLFQHTGEDKRYLEEASRSLDKSLELINRMRELETFLSSHQTLKMYEIRDVINEVSKNISGIEINVTGHCRVMADEALSSVVENILNNAAIHGNADQISIEILPLSRYCQVKIADNGKEIPDELKAEIFRENFSYGETARSGLGLHIVKKTIERYGGDVYALDNQPRGTVIIFSLERVP